MQEVLKNKRSWIGHWLMAVAALHTVFAALAFGKVYTGVWQRGLFNSVGGDPLTAAAVWFLLFGAPLALLALAITPLERSGDVSTLRRLGGGLLATALLGICLMPASGFWLALPPALVMLRGSSKSS